MAADACLARKEGDSPESILQAMCVLFLADAAASSGFMKPPLHSIHVARSYAIRIDLDVSAGHLRRRPHLLILVSVRWLGPLIPDWRL